MVCRGVGVVVAVVSLVTGGQRVLCVGDSLLALPTCCISSHLGLPKGLFTCGCGQACRIPYNGLPGVFL